MTWSAVPAAAPAARTWRSLRSRLAGLGDDAVPRTVVVGAAALLVLAGAAVTLLQFLPSGQTGSVLATLEAVLAAVGAVAWWRWRAKHDTTVAVLLALCCALLGVCYAAIVSSTMADSAPVRWVMTFSHAGAQISFLAAVAYLGRGRQARLGWADAVQALTLFVLVAGVLWVLAPITGQAAEVFSPALRWVPYFYFGASLLGMVLAWYALIRHRERAVRGLGLVCLGVVVLAVTTFAVVVGVLSGDYEMGGPLDLGWMIGTGLIVVAAAAREEPSLTWQRARQRLVLVAALLLVVGVLAVGVTGLVHDATGRIADHHERGAALRHAHGEIGRLQMLELSRPLGRQDSDMVARLSHRAQVDLNRAVALAGGLGVDSPAHEQLVALPAQLATYREHLLSDSETATPEETGRARTELSGGLEEVLLTNYERLNADVESLDRVTAIVRIGVPLGLLVLGGAFVSSWMALGSRERALEQAQARHELTKEVVRAQERERGRIAAELHDGPLQQVAAWRIKLEMALRKLDSDHTAARELITRLDEEIAGQAVELRRLMHALRPPVLDEFGLGTAVRMLAAEAAERGGFKVSVDAAEADTAVGDRDIETLTYRILQEVLTNVGKHAAAAHAGVALRAADGGLSLVVADDGRGMPGFAPDRLVKEGHFGLAGVSERVELAGGRLRVSSAPGKGTTVEAWLPARHAGQARVG